MNVSRLLPILLLLLGHVSPTDASAYVIRRITYQASGIVFSDWISLFTLCLAPLIAHVFSGVSTPVVLTSRPLSWRDRVCLYNPTTILWRYFAIGERRVRSKAWSPAQMAAANAFFWTGRGWDGSEEMISRGRPYCVVLPDTSRATLFSASSAQTLIITLQSIQALYSVSSGIAGGEFGLTIAIDSIFFPIAVFGILRGFAAVWLTENYTYNFEHINPKGLTTSKQGELLLSAIPNVQARPTASIGFLDNAETASETFRSINSPQCTLFRAVYFSLLLGLWVMCVLYLLPWQGSDSFSFTTFLLAILYLVCLTTSIAIYTYYVIRGHSTTTIIPCIASVWYKIYTCVLLVLMVVLIVVAAIETRRTPCGRYTTWSGIGAVDQILCPGLIPLVANSTELPFGIALFESVLDSNTTLPASEFKVFEFTGSCQGIFGNHQIVSPVNSSLRTN